MTLNKTHCLILFDLVCLCIKYNPGRTRLWLRDRKSLCLAVSLYLSRLPHRDQPEEAGSASSDVWRPRRLRHNPPHRQDFDQWPEILIPRDGEPYSALMKHWSNGQLTPPPPSLMLKTNWHPLCSPLVSLSSPWQQWSGTPMAASTPSRWTTPSTRRRSSGSKPAPPSTGWRSSSSWWRGRRRGL